MDAVLRHVGQAMHEANDLVPPPMHPWHFNQFPENDCRGDTPFETADGTMQCFVWHKDQRAVCHCLAAIHNLADDSNEDAS